MIVKKEISLIDFLIQTYNRKNAKNLLKYKQVYVNSQSVSQHDWLLKPGDTVDIKKKENTSLDIIYEDDEFVVINKPSGLLSMSAGNEKEKTAYHLVSEYVKTKNRNNKIYIVHRLDRETSGIIMFCKNQKIRDLLQNNWNDLVQERGYIAIVEGKLQTHEGTLKNYLTENKSQYVYVTSQNKGKLAITHYRVIKSFQQYSLVQVNLDSGRKNQIRVQFAHIHHPITGDKKYGAKTNLIRRLALHANRFGFIHPLTHKHYVFETPAPFDLKK